MPTPHTPRLGFLDGLRAIAILLVIGFHYFAYWLPPHQPVTRYPYEGIWQNIPIFALGLYGVPLFFIISGFVIFLTLSRSSCITHFAIRRVARLWPAMALCSIITFLFLLAFPQLFSTSPLNFLPSLTFLDPAIFQPFTGPLNLMDPAYWSLYVEVRFYALMAVVYFLTPRRAFPYVLLALSLLVPLAHCLMADVWQGQGLLPEALRTFFLSQYLPWFLMGTGFGLLWQGRAIGHALTLSSWFALVFYAGVFTPEHLMPYPPYLAQAATAFLALFYTCRVLPQVRAVLGSKPLAAMGRASYSLYLLHQLIGVTTISLLASAFHLTPAQSLILPFLVTAGLIVLSQLIYKYYEAPLNRALITRFTT